MADFNAAYKVTESFEKGYGTLPFDAGAETFDGVARASHPGWSGWKIIDEIKAAGGGEKQMRAHPDLDRLTKEYYKTAFWDALCLDSFPNQVLAETVFDMQVNSESGGRLLQRALNALNTSLMNSGLVVHYPELVEDGKIGAATLAAIQCLQKRGELNLLYIQFEICRGAYYLACYNNEKTWKDGVKTQRGFARSWTRRVFSWAFKFPPWRDTFR